MTATIIQPTVSSMMAEARITWPTVRRMKFISRITVATILTEAIDSAVPRNSDVISRLPGRAAWSRAAPRRARRRRGTAPRCRRARRRPRRGRSARTSLRSVSMPVSSSSISTPNCATASIIAFCSLAAGNSACWKSGKRAPSTEGPSTSPAMSWPITAGCLMRSMASPSRRPTSISSMIWTTNSSSEGPLGVARPQRRAAHSASRATAAAAIRARDGHGRLPSA